MQAAATIGTVNELAGSQRAVMHAFVMPNRGSGGLSTPDMTPAFLEEELEFMSSRAYWYRNVLRGWKTYPAWGDVPNASGWFLDSDTGLAFLEHVRKVSSEVNEIPPVVAIHKGFALPGFDQRAAAPRDIGPAARAGSRTSSSSCTTRGSTRETTSAPTAATKQARSDSSTVDGLIKSLRENQWDASRFVEPGKRFGNVPNVYAELGSVWRSVMHDPDQIAHLLGKLITHVGPKRVVWGTDSLWYGSPQAEIVALRRFEFSDEGKADLRPSVRPRRRRRGPDRASADAGQDDPQRDPRPQRRRGLPGRPGRPAVGDLVRPGQRLAPGLRERNRNTGIGAACVEPIAGGPHPARTDHHAKGQAMGAMSDRQLGVAAIAGCDARRASPE